MKTLHYFSIGLILIGCAGSLENKKQIDEEKTANSNFLQTATITSDGLGLETIRYTQYIRHRSNGNPFENYQELLFVLFEPISQSSGYNNKECYNPEFVIRLLKSKTNSMEVKFVHRGSDKVNDFDYDGRDDLVLHRKGNNWEFNRVLEMIFDDEKSTYLKVDNQKLQSITTLDDEFFMKLKNHKKVMIKQSTERINAGKSDSHICYYEVDLSIIKEALLNFEQKSFATVKAEIN